MQYNLNPLVPQQQHSFIHGGTTTFRSVRRRRRGPRRAGRQALLSLRLVVCASAAVAPFIPEVTTSARPAAADVRTGADGPGALDVAPAAAPDAAAEAGASRREAPATTTSAGAPRQAQAQVAEGERTAPTASGQEPQPAQQQVLEAVGRGPIAEIDPTHGGPVRPDPPAPAQTGGGGGASTPANDRFGDENEKNLHELAALRKRMDSLRRQNELLAHRVQELDFENQNLAEETNELEEAVATTSSLLEKEEEHRQMQRADHFAEAADPLAGLPPSTKEINILRVRAREKPPPKPVSPAEMTGEINKLLGLNNEVPQGMDPGTAKEPETVLQLLVRASKRDNARDAAGKYVPNQAVAEALYKKNEIADRVKEAKQLLERIARPLGCESAQRKPEPAPQPAPQQAQQPAQRGWWPFSGGGGSGGKGEQGSTPTEDNSREAYQAPPSTFDTLKGIGETAQLTSFAADWSSAQQLGEGQKDGVAAPVGVDHDHTDKAKDLLVPGHSTTTRSAPRPAEPPATSVSSAPSVSAAPSFPSSASSELQLDLGLGKEQTKQELTKKRVQSDIKESLRSKQGGGSLFTAAPKDFTVSPHIMNSAASKEAIEQLCDLDVKPLLDEGSDVGTVHLQLLLLKLSR
mmetsp:Transcript_16076/g.39749  ORF Transcript_16076/g.39749 Transcript_16076/m.39749 type:complete len:633 (-) Transcript_16076:86-1984(-)